MKWVCVLRGAERGREVGGPYYLQGPFQNLKHWVKQEKIILIVRCVLVHIEMEFYSFVVIV